MRHLSLTIFQNSFVIKLNFKTEIKKHSLFIYLFKMAEVLTDLFIYFQKNIYTHKSLQFHLYIYLNQKHSKNAKLQINTIK